MFAEIALALWRFLPLSYLLTVCIELPVLLTGLSHRHHWKQRVYCAFWLTACSYPVVILVIPLFVDSLVGSVIWKKSVYQVASLIFTLFAECVLFWQLTRPVPESKEPAPSRANWWQDFGTLLGANLLSFFLVLWLMELPLIKNWTHPTQTPAIQAQSVIEQHKLDS